MKAGYTHVSILLDRSGSMASIKTDTIGGFNTFIEEQKKVPGEMTLTLCQFDTEYESLYNSLNIQAIPPLSDRTFVPRGGTALLDAVAKTIIDTGQVLANLAESYRPERVMIVIITDGQENSSREQTRASVSAMVKHQEEDYNWQFVYIGANQDAFAEGASMGMKTSVNYMATKEGTASTYRAFSKNVTSNRGRAAGQNVDLTQSDIDNS